MTSDGSPSIYWHVGYAMAASTYLQSWLYKEPSIHFVGLRQHLPSDRLPEWRLFATRNDFEYDELRAVECLDTVRREANGKPIIISHEVLSGSAYGGTGISSSLPDVSNLLRHIREC